MLHTRVITLDNGGSEARVLPKGCTVTDGMMRVKNEYYKIEGKDFRVRETEDPFGICKIIRAPEEEYLGIIGQGATGRLYNGTKLSMGGMKTESLEYYLEFIYNVARDAATYFEKERWLEDSRMNLQFHMLDYVIGTCVPVKEYSGNKDCANHLKEKLEGKYEVVFPLVSDRPINFKISKAKLGVVAEGGVAILAIKDTIGKGDISVIGDMGQVSFDLAVYEGLTLYGKVHTFYYAGHTFNMLVMSALEDAGYYVKESEVEDIVKTGKVKVFAEEKDVSSIIKEQKELYVNNYVVKEFERLLTINMLDKRQVKNFIPIGAPMNRNDATGNLADIIVSKCGLQGATIKYLSDDLRYVNVQQASKLTARLSKRVEELRSE